MFYKGFVLLCFVCLLLVLVFICVCLCCSIWLCLFSTFVAVVCDCVWLLFVCFVLLGVLDLFVVWCGDWLVFGVFYDVMVWYLICGFWICLLVWVALPSLICDFDFEFDCFWNGLVIVLLHVNWLLCYICYYLCWFGFILLLRFV